MWTLITTDVIVDSYLYRYSNWYTAVHLNWTKVGHTTPPSAGGISCNIRFGKAPRTDVRLTNTANSLGEKYPSGHESALGGGGGANVRTSDYTPFWRTYRDHLKTTVSPPKDRKWSSVHSPCNGIYETKTSGNVLSPRGNWLSLRVSSCQPRLAGFTYDRPVNRVNSQTAYDRSTQDVRLILLERGS